MSVQRVPPGNRLKNRVCFTKFYTHEGDVLGIRHRLNSSSCGAPI